MNNDGTECDRRSPTDDVCIFAPTPLLTVTIEKEADDEPRMHLHVGGQGAWIARMVSTLGARARYCGAFGGETGQVARFLCEDENFDLRAVETAGWNGAYVHDRRSGERMELAAAPASPLSRHELDDLYSTTLSAALTGGACVIAGAHSEGVVPDDIYPRLAGDLGGSDVPVVADLAGSSLSALIGAGPTALKVSDEELQHSGWASGDSRRELIDSISRLRDAGALDVVVSRGSRPTVALIAGKLYEVRSPDVEVVDSRGGGDAMTAALGVALARRLPAEDTLRLAAAAATATVTRHGLGTGRRELIEATMPRVDVVVLDGS